MLPDNASALAERLLVLTLALESALKEDNFSDAQSLFEQRSLIMQDLEQMPTQESFMLQKVAQIDLRIEADMTGKAQAIADELRKSNLGLVAHRAYQPKGSKSASGTLA